MRFFEDNENKKIIYLFLSIVIISALIFMVIFLWYNNKLTKEAELSLLSMNNLKTENDVSYNKNVAEVSFSEDKDIKNVIAQNEINALETTNEKSTNAETKENDTKKDDAVQTVSTSKVKENTSVPEEEYEGNEIEVGEYAYEYEAPISGDIIKDYAEDSLVYSKTLDEWTTHLGIDIRADKTSVVKAAEKGTIESIKNDPRYGLTIIIAHDDGIKTIYSNLLSSEFVNVGDSVEKGQAIGTVGQSASFEAADEAHLHFEMYKDGKNVNPTIYLK